MWNEGERVRIICSHGDDLYKEGTIQEVRCSFCKILIDGEDKPRNHTYGQFERIV